MSAVRTVQLGMAGCGTVGDAVARLVTERHYDLLHRLNLDLRLACVVVQDPAKQRSADVPAEVLTTDEVQAILRVHSSVTGRRRFVRHRVVSEADGAFELTVTYPTEPVRGIASVTEGAWRLVVTEPASRRTLSSPDIHVSERAIQAGESIHVGVIEPPLTETSTPSPSAPP